MVSFPASGGRKAVRGKAGRKFQEFLQNDEPDPVLHLPDNQLPCRDLYPGHDYILTQFRISHNFLIELKPSEKVDSE